MFLLKTSLNRFHFARSITTSSVRYDKRCKLLVVGGGSGGISLASKFSRLLKNNQIIIIEPSQKHYYQPLFTLIGGGLNNINQSYVSTKNVIPKKCLWIQDTVIDFIPDENKVKISKGEEISYDYMIVSLGIDLHYEKIPGALEALKDPKSNVCSNYHSSFVIKTFPLLKNLREGNAIFTYPDSMVKCAGAPQKIAYIADDYLRRNGRRDKVNIDYYFSTPFLFSCPYYEKPLIKLCENRKIDIHKRMELVKVDDSKKEVTFKNLDKPDDLINKKYSFLHITPHQYPPEVLRKSKLADKTGFMDVSKTTLQHTKYKNIYGIGDCTNLPTSKTLTAVAGQVGPLYSNLSNQLANKSEQSIKYDGYTACPIVTSNKTVIMAEFDYDKNSKETFPIDQRKELASMYYMKSIIIPIIYWQLMLRGFWSGPPEFVRKIFNKIKISKN